MNNKRGCESVPIPSKRQKMGPMGSKSKICYSFSFVPDTNDAVLIPSVIPQEIWLNHIVPYLKRKTLKQLKQTCRGFLFLVSQVLHLTWVWRHYSVFLKFREKWLNWPSKVFGIYTDDTTQDFQSLIRIPEMKFLDLSYSKEAVLDTDLSYLPPTLTSLSLSSCHNLSVEGFFALPQSLLELDLSRCYQFDESIVTSLPTTLTKLNLSGTSILTQKSAASLPASLTNLELNSSYLRAEGLSSLPSTLRVLSINKISTGIKTFNCLPPNLRTLFCEGSENESKDFQGLPTTLKRLQLDGSRKITSEIAAYLPPSLTILTLSRTEVCDTLFPFLPSTLTTLDVSHTSISGIGFGHLKTSLVFLDISGCSDLLWDQYFLSLPSTLKTLAMEELPRLPSVPLPKNLQKLYASSHCDIENGFFASLPNGLRYLILKSYPRPLPSGFEKVLPTKLKKLVLNNRFSVAAYHDREQIIAKALPNTKIEIALCHMGHIKID